MNQTTDTPVNRLYKSRIFAMLYQDKKELLDLYNAISGKHYEDPELLEINTLENAIYMTMRNDLSFLIDFRLSLYEHQSTYSPNLPLRDLFYISDLYSGMVKDENLYGVKLVQIPTPQFVIFYNGVDQHIIIWHFRRIKLCRNNAGIFHPRTPGILVITVIEKIITVITRLKMGYFNFPDSANYGIK